MFVFLMVTFMMLAAVVMTVVLVIHASVMKPVQIFVLILPDV